MNNTIDKVVPIQLGAVSASLKFGWNAIALLEETTGKSLTDMLGSKDKTTGEIKAGDIGKVPFSTLRLLVWAGISHQMRIELNDVGDMMDSSDTKTITEAVTKALSSQLAKPANAIADGDPDPNAPPSTNG